MRLWDNKRVGNILHVGVSNNIKVVCHAIETMTRMLSGEFF